MQRGRPKSDPTTPSRKGRIETQAPDAFDGLANPTPKTNDPRQPRKTHKLSLEGAILSDPNLSKADKLAIVAAGKNGVTVGDLAMLVTYELKVAQRFFANSTLAAKDYIVALNKIASQVAAAAQLGVSQQAGIPSQIAVTFTSDGPHIVDGARERPAPGPCGDVVEVE